MQLWLESNLLASLVCTVAADEPWMSSRLRMRKLQRWVMAKLVGVVSDGWRGVSEGRLIAINTRAVIIAWHAATAYRLIINSPCHRIGGNGDGGFFDVSADTAWHSPPFSLPDREPADDGIAASPYYFIGGGTRCRSLWARVPRCDRPYCH